MSTVHSMPAHERASFLLLRCLLSLSVVFIHFAALGDDPAGPVRGISGMVSIQAFFVISGWIVSSSCDQSNSIRSFWLRRVARLYPLYLFVVCAQALLALTLATPGPDAVSQLFRYLAANLSFANFLKPSLFGLFDSAPIPEFNPSLWTLKIEVMFYAIVPLFVHWYRTRGARVLLWLFAGSSVFHYLVVPHSAQLARQFPGQLRFFIAGMLCWQLAAAGFGLARGRRWLAPIAVLGLIASHLNEMAYWSSLTQPFLVAAFVYGASHLLPEPRRLPDISYGLYVLHAPTIQLGFLLGLLTTSRPGLLLAVVVTSLLATASWYAIEKPAIQAAKGRSFGMAQRRRVASMPARIDEVPL